ncbi:MAG TPA: ankyrin repeat domain-containing protein [Verrucomicrobiae bacterium]|nr:ankyrin repeat domain-containing protein [Verrucomicrobiae bacterium]
MFGKLKSLFGTKPPRVETAIQAAIPEVSWIPADKNAFNVRILDVRPVTQTVLATSRDPKCAANAVSYGQEDGGVFAKDQPESSRSVAANLSYRIDRLLAPGVLFAPHTMEHKWALFYHDGRILCVQSWLRKVAASARVECSDGLARITSIQGAFVSDSEEDDFSVRTMDYLVRSHALRVVFPAPFPPKLETEPRQAAMWCMSVFGSMALCATPHRFEAPMSERPLRTLSLLHIAAAKGDINAADRHLRSGLPIDLLAGDGLAPLHWAFAQKDTAMAEFLIRQGAPVDVRSAEGATPLMTIVQGGEMEKIRFLLSRGADVNAVDLRGFTSLHRAAEAGNIEIVRLLLDRGARRDFVAQGLTPASLAEKRGHGNVVELLKPD